MNNVQYGPSPERCRFSIANCSLGAAGSGVQCAKCFSSGGLRRSILPVAQSDDGRVSERDAGRLQGLLKGGRLVRLVLETIVSKRIALEPALHLHAPHYGMGPKSIRVEGLARTHLFGDIRDRD